MLNPSELPQRPWARRIALSSLAVVACATASAALGCSGHRTTPEIVATQESWCPDGFEVGPSDTCFAIPEAHGKETPVLVYLHGMYKGHGSPEEWALVHGAVDKGFAVVIPRGRRGLCAWKAELADHFCWPQEADDPQPFKAVVREWERVLWQVDALMDGGTHKRYVLAFSNGAFFGEYVEQHELFAADAWALVGGGPLETVVKPAVAPPTLLIAADGDEWQGPKTRELHEGFTKAGWSHAYCTRGGSHGLAKEDVEASLRFFKKEAAGGLRGGAPLACEPPLKSAP